MDERKIPSLVLNILLTQVDEMMGRRSLIMLLRQTDLPGYIDDMPPLDDSPSITVEAYSQLVANIYGIFGARAAQPLFHLGGRRGASELRRQRPAQFAFFGTALRLLSEERRLRIILERLAEDGAETYGADYRLQEDADAFFFEIRRCPYCAEIARRGKEQSKPATRPVCHIPAAILDEMTEWATGQKHLVEEITCIALGAVACRFRVRK
jgi:predicted hydrocarbon binding protein